MTETLKETLTEAEWSDLFAEFGQVLDVLWKHAENARAAARTDMTGRPRPASKCSRVVQEYARGAFNAAKVDGFDRAMKVHDHDYLNRLAGRPSVRPTSSTASVPRPSPAPPSSSGTA